MITGSQWAGLVQLLDTLNPDVPCMWRAGTSTECTATADWYLTFLIHGQTEHHTAFCSPHRRQSELRTAGLPIDIIDVQPVKANR